MHTRKRRCRLVSLVLLATSGVLHAAGDADGPDRPEVASGMRTEVFVGAHAWPGIGELEPRSEGHFDDAGFSLGAAVHWPLEGFGAPQLQVGVDMAVFATESDIDFRRESLIARGAWLVPSVRWYPGNGPHSIDAGAGVYLVDIAEVTGEYGFFIETELWEQSGLGGYVGATWNFGGGAAASGLTVSVRVHHFDLGTVRDEDLFLPATLGNDAGSLTGPVFQLQVGYRRQ